MINQGDVFWVNLGEPAGSEPGYLHPYVVIQNNLLNHSRIKTVVVCLITSNLDRGVFPGNVRLYKGEASLSKPCVVNVTQLFTIDKQQLGSKIGILSPKRVQQILAGLQLITEPREVE